MISEAHDLTLQRLDATEAELEAVKRERDRLQITVLAAAPMCSTLRQACKAVVAIGDGYPGLLVERDRYRQALERAVVCCDNGATAMNKVTFIRQVAAAALNQERPPGA